MKVFKILGSLPREAVRKLTKSCGPKNLEKYLERDLYKVVRDAGCPVDIADRLAVAFKFDTAKKVLGHVEWALSSRSTISRSMLITKIQFALELPRDTVSRVLDSVISSGKLVAVESGKIVTRRHYEANVRIAEDIKNRAKEVSTPLDFGDIGELEGRQKVAIETAARHRVSIITGPPGTGKSFVVRAMTSSSRVAARVTAPTGRAARNALGKTIHHFKTIQEAGQNDFAGVELAIVDESSMLSVDLFAMVLDLVPESAHIVLVGDVDQLPPIDAGDVFRDLIESGVVPVTVLEVNHRCSDDALNAFARGIRDGTVLDPPEAVTFHECYSRDDVLNKVPWFSLEERGMVLTPHNATRVDINRVCQLAEYGYETPIAEFDLADGTRVRGWTAFNDAREAMVEAGHIRSMIACAPKVVGIPKRAAYDAGESLVLSNNRIIVTKNTQTACNGDVGVFLSKVKDGCVVNFNGAEVMIPRISPHDAGITLAYAITVHKSQGSEFERVILPVVDVHAWDRTLLYTAITRSKKQVHILGSREDLEAIVQCTRPPRPSLLRNFL